MKRKRDLDEAAAAVPMIAGGDDDALTALREQLSLASAAAISASDLDHAFELQLAEAIEASLRGQSTPNAAASSSLCWSQSSPPPLHEPPSDAACALALQAADLTRAEQDRRDAEDCRAAHAAAAASVRIAAHDALFARKLAAVPEDRWAEEGDLIERPMGSSSAARPHFRVFSKGLASGDVVGPRDRDPGVARCSPAPCAGLRGRRCSGYRSRWTGRSTAG
ncbi:hypothetical protein PR202_gb00400 [Eleusine coracana subsp. coracana]|uniref:Uncharacterized protein n=1 Tax=Eleusine coracana subsp. coracana TaxID=191504 RepID=A0AAV5DTA0_ELECO|nr:hypothetical protein PR202_gb00400 [Eleusine coracana subsp. coracana]